MLRHQQFIRSLALTGMAIAALIAPHAASAMPVADPQHVLQAKHVLIDLRSPDAATPVVIPQVKQDLRSPDAATPVVLPQTKVDLRSPDAATPLVRPATKVDLRSPDTQVPFQPTQDLRSPDTQVPVQPTTPKVGAPVAQPGSSNDFDWGSAAVGAGIALLLALVAVGSIVAVNRKRPLTLGH
jgi:hypothetical protein